MLKDNLKTLRRMTGLNQRQLADELGVSVKTVSHWEAGYSETVLEYAFASAPRAQRGIRRFARIKQTAIRFDDCTNKNRRKSDTKKMRQKAANVNLCSEVMPQ